MKVRENLANNAVARACTFLYPEDPSKQIVRGATATRARERNEGCVGHAGGTGSPLHLVEIQDQTYGLSLGWKISKTSYEVVSWMLGTPETCPGRDNQSTVLAKAEEKVDAPSTHDPNAKIRSDTLKRNSCVLRTIRELVNGTLRCVARADGSPASSPTCSSAP
jgi:hypothetical protein